MKLWPLASAATAFLALALFAGPQAREAYGRANELTLAGLRPGRDTLAAAEKRFGTKIRVTQDEGDDIKQWRDGCAGRSLRLEVDDQGVIQSATVSSLEQRNPDCREEGAPSPLGIEQLKTGRGLALGQTRKRVVALYGEPNSEGPTTVEGREFELLFYAFDWAGTDVPQVMEVTCERGTGRVRKITLAFPSL